jgi:isoleucyl-tRNA synthetase
MRRPVFADLEEMRARKEIGSSLEAEVEFGFPAEVVSKTHGIDFTEIFIVSNAVIHTATGQANDSTLPFSLIKMTKTDNSKCGRCWRYLPEVGEDGDLCARCTDVVGQ